MNIEQAKRKWCPWARIDVVGVSVNRCGPEADYECTCLADGCACWVPEKVWCREEQKMNDSKTYGYCGLIKRES